MTAVPNVNLAEYRFGRFRLTPSERQLLADGKAISLGPRAFELLVVLVERAGHLVTKDEIHRLVWPGLVVEDNSLQVQISALRKILGYDAITTIPGIGYRFVLALEINRAGDEPSAGRGAAVAVASVEPSQADHASSTATHATTVGAATGPAFYRFRRTWIATAVVLVALLLGSWLLWSVWGPGLLAAGNAPPMSIAILPFKAGAGEAAETKFADALTQDVTSDTARDVWVKVAPSGRTSAFKGQPFNARQVGRSLNVRYVADGEVRREGNKYVVSQRLLDANTEIQVWSERFEFPVDESATAHRRPFQLVVDKLMDGLFKAERQRAVQQKADQSAEELTLRGWDAYSRDLKGILAAKSLFADALRRDQKFVPAIFAYVVALFQEGVENPAPDRARLSGEADFWSSLAIRSGPTQVQAWRARTLTLFMLGRWDEALAANDKARALEPDMAALVADDRAYIFQFSGRPAQALAAAEQALAMDPDVAGVAYHYICKAKLYLGQYQAALGACEKAAALMNHWWVQFYLVAAYTHNGETAKAAKAKEALFSKQPGYTLARYRAMLHSSPPAFFELFDKHVAPALLKAGIPDA
jgi:DNA-binding winged helix-turn-helix (wHTH) protein/TolB-like protein